MATDATHTQPRGVDFRFAFDAFVDPAYFVDAETRIVLHANKAACEFYGYATEELVGKNVAEINTASEREIERAVEEARNGRSSFTFRHRLADGELQDVSIVVSPADPNAEQLLVVVKDVTAVTIVEEGLRKERERYRLLADAAEDVVWFANREGVVAYVAPSITRVTGFRDDEALGEGLYNLFVDRETKASLQTAMREIAGNPAAREKKTFGARCRKKPNGEFWASVAVSPAFDDRGNFVGYSGAIKDRSERKIIETKLRESEELYRKLLKAVPDAVTVSDDEQTITHVSERTLEIYRIKSEDEVVGTKIYDWVAPKEHGRAAARLRALVRNRASSKANIYLLKRGDGTTFWGEILSASLQDPEGKLKGVVSITRDVTERLDAEARLRRSEDMLRKIVENVPVGVWTSDERFNLLVWNRAQETMTGVSREAVLGKNIFDLFPSLVESGLEKKSRRVLETGKPLTLNNYPFFDAKLKRAQYYLNIKAFPILGEDDEPDGVMAAVEDVTDRKLMIERLEDALSRAEETGKIKSALLANMNHELRTPMNGVIGLADIIQEESAEESVVELARDIQKTSKRLMNTLGAVLELSALKTDGRSFNLQPYPAAEILRDVERRVAPLARAKGIELRVSMKAPDLAVRCDPRYAKTALFHIAENAVKFTARGSVALELDEPPIRERGVALLSVADTGVGISEEHRELIFQEFRQASEGWSRRFEGSGLGLSLAKKMISLMGGEIDFESRLGEGSVFYVTLPLANEAAPPTPEEAEPEAPPEVEPSGEKPRALVIEDNKLNSELMTLFLKDLFELESVESGADAIGKAKTTRYDVLFMDINLGAGVNGVEALRSIRALDDYHDTPAVAVTGYAMIGDRERLFEEGFTHYLAKPFVKDDLLNVARQALGSQKR
jgi:PAS domain S-box-containing protein